jgi:hypothetical protein
LSIEDAAGWIKNGVPTPLPLGALDAPVSFLIRLGSLDSYPWFFHSPSGRIRLEFTKKGRDGRTPGKLFSDLFQ